MKAASIAELKKALVKLDQGELLDACLRLARFKKDNKELLTYLLFLAEDERGYASYLCDEIDEQFSLTPNAHKKTLRKTIRWMDKCLRFSAIKETEIQVRVHFCRALKASDTPYLRSRVMTNMFTGQIKKIHKAIEKFHEDIQYDYRMDFKDIDPSMSPQD
ncbi:MAG: hypothetical protein ACI87E_003765 [Mariniblastus sp.]|jgi:hypothetical protein